MYVHGYGSNGSALKGQQLREIFPGIGVVSPTLDYEGEDPYELQAQLRREIEANDVRLIVGSSLGGYHTLCATAFFEGPVWCLNPVHDIKDAIDRVLVPTLAGATVEQRDKIQRVIDIYSRFDEELFQRLPRREGQLHFALSTDDELLGDHKPLLSLFPHYAKVVWKDDCKHQFFRFMELRDDIAATIPFNHI